EVFDTEEIVVKPLGSLLKDVGVYQGATILGDGRVVMILDVAGIVSRSGGRSAYETRSDSSIELARDATSKTTNLLLFDSGNKTTMAVPLALVSRLEEFTMDRIEQAGEQLVVQYRGKLLPLMTLEGTASSNELRDPQSVLVFSEDRKSMGLIVRNILDIVDEELVLSMRSNRPGVLGTAIINGAATDIIDTKHYLSLAHPDWYSRKPVQQTNHIVIVDDSAFFRQLIKTNLEIEGHSVQTFDDARLAMKAIEMGTSFDILITDIEMPQVDGYTLLKWLKNQPQCQQKPIFAMSSLNTPNVEAKALKSGADRFVPKANLGRLMDEIEEFRRNSQIRDNREVRA
ncbi:MAG: response regulator, partial [Planctomycetaceae bacterium]|nr:response regulator [Planctomycetaceae bacterium]